ncbi:hypothetical protein Tco_0189557 [Tanacetum coccineum]
MANDTRAVSCMRNTSLRQMLLRVSYTGVVVLTIDEYRAKGAKPKDNLRSNVLVWTSILWLTHKRQSIQRAKRKYQPIDCLADPRRQPLSSCRQLGYERETFGGVNLNPIFMKIEAHLLSPRGPQGETMVDLQPERKGVQGVKEEGMGTGSREGPSAPTLLAQTTHSPTFIKENIDMLRTMIKEHDQQTKTKATLKKLTYDDSEEERSKSSKTKGLLERSSDRYSETARTRNKVRSSEKSQRSLSRSKTSSHLRRSERLGSQSRSKAKAKEGRTKSRTRRPMPTPFTTRITRFKYHRRAKLPRNIKVYEGSIDLEDHLGSRTRGVAHADLVQNVSPNLKWWARNWFDDSDPKSVDTFEELSQKILEEFSQ